MDATPLTVGLFTLAAYLLGAVPFGFVMGKLKGVDVREHGSRNIGATNTGRVLGRKWGVACLALDILKGLVPVALFGVLVAPHPPDPAAQLQWILVGLAAVLGHLFPVYLGFRGGKGVATTIGVALGVYPFFTVSILISVVGYFIVRFWTGKVSLGSLTLAVIFPASTIGYALLSDGIAAHWPLVGTAALLGLLIIVRHRDNIRRLVAGSELEATSSQQ